MSKRLFSHDSTMGITKWWHYDADTDRATIETVQDAAPLLDANAMERDAHNGRFGDGMHKVASIPMTLYHEFKKKGLFDENKHKLLPLLRSEYPHLLTVKKI